MQSVRTLVDQDAAKCPTVMSSIVSAIDDNDRTCFIGLGVKEDMDTCASVLDPEQPRLYYAHNFVMVLSTSSEHHYITSALYNADTLRDGGGGRPEPFIVIADSSPDPDLSTNAAISRDHLRRLYGPAHHPAIAQLKVYHVSCLEQINAGSSGLYAALNASALMARGQMRLNKKRRVVELLSDGGYSPLDLQGDFTRQEVWLLRQSVVLWYAYRAVLQFPQRVSELLSFLQVSDHVASVLLPVPSLPRRALTVTIEDTRVLREMFSLSHFLLTVSFPAPQTLMAAAAPDVAANFSSAASRLLTAIHTPPALRDETGMTHIFSP
jgi:hypothetical protein